MKLQMRFLLLLMLIFGGVTGILVVQHLYESNYSKDVLVSELQQRKQYFRSVTSLEGAALQTLSEDYSFWNEMVAFIKTNNISFAEESLDTSLDTYGANADWVYRANGTLLYHSNTSDTDSLKNLNLPVAFFQKLDKEKFMHFYEQTSGGLVEIRAATIVPGDDPSHATTPQGYLLIGRLIDDSYVKKLANLTQSNIELNGKASNSTDQTNKATATVAFNTPLKNWSGKPVAHIKSTSTVPVISDLNESYMQQLKLVWALTILLTTATGVALWWFVLRPLSSIIIAIKSQQAERLNNLAATSTEFGQLAQTVQAFFAQKISLAEAEFRKQELEKLNKEKIAFLAIAAHELNGPASNVRVFTDYLMFLWKKKQDTSKIDNQIQRINHQAIKINMLVNDLREASQGNQTLQYNKRSFDFDTFLQEEIEEAAFTIKHKLILNGKTNQTVTSDPDRIGQVVTNLLRNAYKYSPNAQEIYISSKVENNFIIVGVQDFGMGIAPEEQEKIFQRFYRASNVTSTIPGLGLGLSISRHIIEQLGGKIWVDSTPNKGSTFYFSLPIQPALAKE